MKAYKFNIVTLISFIVIVCSNPLSLTAKSEHIKTIEKHFSLAEGGKVNIENKHGLVRINTWDRNEVDIVVTIKVNANSKSKAEETFNRINVEFSNDDRYVSATTEIESKRSVWWFIKSWWNNDDIEINYEVSMPRRSDLELSHKYGNAELAEISGDVMVELKYGNLSADHAAEKMILDMAYGNAFIAQVKNLEAEFAYGKLQINDADVIDLDSKYSKIEIESANQLRTESGYDDYKLGDVGSLENNGKYDNFDIKKIERIDIETRYTKIDIDYLTQSAVASLSYGGIEIDRAGEDVREIDVTSRYAGIVLDLNELSSFQIDVESRHTSVKMRDDIVAKREIRDNEDVIVEGHVGSESSPNTIKVRSDYGSLRVY